MSSRPGACPHEHDDAAYVLGALAPDERVAFERHLASCEACSGSVAGLAGMPGLLARVPRDVVDPPDPGAASAQPPLPDTLLPRLVREVRRTRRSRAWLTTAMVGTAAAVAAVAVGFAVTHDDPSGSTQVTGQVAGQVPGADSSVAPAIAMRSVGDDAVAASISLTPVGWGTRLELTCDERGESAPAGRVPAAWSSYAMFVHTSDGNTEQVATWQALPGKIVHVSGATAADRSQITDVDVRNAAGDVVLNLGG